MEMKDYFIALAAVVAVFAWFLNKRVLLNQALENLLKDYRSFEMGYAINELWRLYRDCRENKECLKAEYIRRMEHDLIKIRNLKPEQREIEIKAMLHFQRRIVSHFYHHLAALWIKGILPKIYIYKIWSKNDLAIIPLIIIPIEEALTNSLGANIIINNQKLCNIKELYDFADGGKADLFIKYIIDKSRFIME
jgi:hypothetical protein